MRASRGSLHRDYLVCNLKSSPNYGGNPIKTAESTIVLICVTWGTHMLEKNTEKYKWELQQHIL